MALETLVRPTFRPFNLSEETGHPIANYTTRHGEANKDWFFFFADIGANASAEEAEEALDEGAEQVNNVVYSFRLQPTSFDKKSYMSHLKGYMKSVKAKLQEKGADADTISAFEKGAQKYVKETLIPNFKDFEFYTGESMDVDGLYVH